MSEKVRNGTFVLWTAFVVGLIVIAVFSWNFAFQEGRQSARQSYNAERSAADATQRDYQKCAAKPTTREAIECYRAARRASDETYRSYSDLDAQWQSADWTKATAWTSNILGFFSLVVAASGVVWVRWTLLETRRLGKSQIRAYLHVTGVRLFNVNTNGLSKFALSYKNYGQSPARNIVINTKVSFAHGPLGESEHSFQKTEHGFDLAPGQKRQMDGDAFLDAHGGIRRALESRIMHMYIYGRISYVDVFEDNQWTDFRLMLDPETAASGLCDTKRFIVCDTGNHSK